MDTTRNVTSIAPFACCFEIFGAAAEVRGAVWSRSAYVERRQEEAAIAVS